MRRTIQGMSRVTLTVLQAVQGTLGLPEENALSSIRLGHTRINGKKCQDPEEAVDLSVGAEVVSGGTRVTVVSGHFRHIERMVKAGAIASHPVVNGLSKL